MYNQTHIFSLVIKLMTKIRNFKLVIMLEYQKYKKIFANSYTPNWSEEVFVIKKVKNTVPWTYVINDLNGKEIVGTFYQSELQEQIKKGLELKKSSREKVINYMLNGKDTIIHLIVGSMKKTQYKMSDFFPEPKYIGGEVKLKLGLSNYATKTDFKKWNMS